MYIKVYLTELKNGFRTKVNLFWNMIFPLILGTLFYVAFSSLYNNDKASTLKIAIDREDSMIESVLKGIKYDNGEAMFDITVTDSDEAIKLLKSEKVCAILHPQYDMNVKMYIKNNGTSQSIVADVVASYRQALATHGQVYDKDIVVAKGIAGENKDPYIMYFYNLIAMTSLLGITGAIAVFTSSNPGQYVVGVRELAAPICKPLYELMKLLATTTFQIISIVVAIVYYVHILGLSFGCDEGYIYLTAVLGVLLGQAIGFGLGHIYSLKESTRVSIAMVLSLGGGFLSGLYVGDMKLLIDTKCPIINRINPFAVISDAFYTLNIYGGGERYMRSVIYMCVCIVVCFVFGFIKAGRNQYASI